MTETLPRNDVLRLTRDGGDRGPSLAERLAERMDRISFASPLHKLRLKGRFPLKLLAVPVDPVAGDPHAGARLQAGELSFAGFGETMAHTRLDDSRAPAAWHDWLHGWGWLRDISTAPSLNRSQIGRVEGLSKRWLARFHNYDPIAWGAAVTGRRIMMAMAYAPLVMPGHDHIHRSAVLNGIARWARHLDRAAPRAVHGHGRAEAAAGLIAAALLLPGGDERRHRAERLLIETLESLLHADGSGVTRSPLDLARLGDLLLFTGAFYEARAQHWPMWLTDTLDSLRASLSGLVMGDGRPGPWHGGQPTRETMLRLMTRAEPLQPGRDSGYQRLSAGDVVIVVDAGPPPPARLTDNAHASTLAFMASDGDRLLVVSCGGEAGASPDGGRTLPGDLVMGLRSTAGHSALILADTNSSRLTDSGPRKLGGVEEVLVETRMSEQGQWLEARHDGYKKRFGVYHMRRLYLAPDGNDLRGEDQLLPVRSGPARSGDDTQTVVIRFHIGPDWVIHPTEDGRGAVILPAGQAPEEGDPDAQVAWLFRTSFNSAPGQIRVEPSLMIDSDGGFHNIRQLVLQTVLEPGHSASIGWSFRRHTD